MRIVKLDRRHKLHWWGYTHAVRFPRKNADATNVVNALSRFYGDNSNSWSHYRSDRRDRPSFWIGVKDEKMLTLALLAKDQNVTV